MNKVPNLDCMEIDDLDCFYSNYFHASNNRAAELFPERPKGYRNATRDLACYAINKLVAMQQRNMGYITTAIVYERICEKIYKKLPDYAKW